MAEAIGFLLRLLLFSLLAARGFYAIASAGSAENAEKKDVLVADSEGDPISDDGGDESSWVNGPTEGSTLEQNETSSYNFTANELPEAEPLKQNRSVLKHQNLSSRFQQASTDNPGKPLQEPRSCLPTEPHQPPCPTQGPQQQPCPPVVPQQPTCPSKDSTTLQVPDALPEQLSQVLKLLKLLNYKPEVLQEEEHRSPSPPHFFLPKWLQEVQQHGFVPKRLFGPKQHGYLPKWSPVLPQRHGYPPDKPRHYDYQVQENWHQSAQVPQQYDSEPYGFQLLEPHSQGYPSREFREPHSYLPHEFWEPQPHGYQSRKPQPQPHEYLPQESQPHGYPFQDPMERQMPKHEKPDVKPQVHRMSRYKPRWTAYLPQRPHYVAIRPWHPANKARFKTRQPVNSPQMFYYIVK